MTAVKNGDIRPIDDTVSPAPDRGSSPGWPLPRATIHPDVAIPPATDPRGAVGVR